MKKLVSLLLVVCLLIACSFVTAEEDAIPEDAIRFRIWNESDAQYAYIRFAVYKGDEFIRYQMSYQWEGNDFINADMKPDELAAQNENELKGKKLVISIGYSDEEEPLQAILNIMFSGAEPNEESVKEIPLDSGFSFGCGYYYTLVTNEDGGYDLIPREELVKSFL